MSKWKKISSVLALMLLGITVAYAQVSVGISVGSDQYYQPVGDYDYLPYAYQTNQRYAAPRINFYDMMSQYGVWVTVPSFGQVWKPYAEQGWRPYTYGHWVNTQQYGQMWEGYEPWAWVGYHYGNWVFDRSYGWVWIPGYDWHAGRVTWAQSYGSIGWMPTPPSGYDYSRGYLSDMGPNNQFSYNDSDFGMNNYNYGGPYYNSQYRDMYYNQAAIGLIATLFNFINNDHYGYDNYANYSLGNDYSRQVFDRRLVRITNRPIDRPVLERFLGRRIQETPVDVRQFQTDRQAIQVVVPRGTAAVTRIRRQSGEVVRDVIAPGFVEKRREFKGQNSINKKTISGIFGQENLKPRVETLSSEQIINRANKARLNREQGQKIQTLAATEKLVKIEKTGKIKEPKTADTLKLNQQSDAKAQKSKEIKLQSNANAQRKAENLKLKQESDAKALKAADARKLKSEANAQKSEELKLQSDATKAQKEADLKLKSDSTKTQQTTKKKTVVTKKKKKAPVKKTTVVNDKR
jgi:hypothetical protein